jgi:hypothetical protein
MSANPSDPCVQFETDGEFDFGKFFDTAVPLIECGYEEAKKLPGIFGHIIQVHLGYELSAIRAARNAHTQFAKDQAAQG